MRTSRTPRLTAAHAEHLLDGGRGTGPLPPFLAAAAGPGTARELAGEAAARAAFATAQLDRPIAPLPLRSPPMPRTLLSRVLAAKALAVVALAAGTTGGVALAASTTVESSHVRSTVPASTGPSAAPAVDARESVPSTTTPSTRAATTVARPATGRPEVAGSGTDDDGHCRAVAAGLPSTSPAPLPPGAANGSSAAAEHACAVNAPGRTAGSPSPGNGGDQGNGTGRGRSPVRTTAPVPLPLPGLTNGG